MGWYRGPSANMFVHQHWPLYTMTTGVTAPAAARAEPRLYRTRAQALGRARRAAAEAASAAGSQPPTRGRRLAVWACLQGVTDPELDESVVDLNFVTRADVDTMNRVHIEFRLPTYWCAANFSFLMADDMRSAVSALDWVEGVSVVLGEHMYADKINAGLARGLSFQETFGTEADRDFQLEYDNNLFCPRPERLFYAHPCMERTRGVKLDELPARQSFTHADMYRLIMRLPLDSPIARPKLPEAGPIVRDTVMIVEATT